MIVSNGDRASHERNIRNMASVAVSLRGLVIACLYLLCVSPNMIVREPGDSSKRCVILLPEFDLMLRFLVLLIERMHVVGLLPSISSLSVLYRW